MVGISYTGTSHPNPPIPRLNFCMHANSLLLHEKFITRRKKIGEKEFSLNEWRHRTLHLEPGKCLKNEEELLLACSDWKSANGYTTGYRLFFSLGGRKPKACLLSLQFLVFLTLKWALNWFISAVILGSQKLCLFILQFITLLVF